MNARSKKIAQFAKEWIDKNARIEEDHEFSWVEIIGLAVFLAILGTTIP